MFHAWLDNGVQNIPTTDLPHIFNSMFERHPNITNTVVHPEFAEFEKMCPMCPGFWKMEYTLQIMGPLIPFKMDNYSTATHRIGCRCISCCANIIICSCLFSIFVFAICQCEMGSQNVSHLDPCNCQKCRHAENRQGRALDASLVHLAVCNIYTRVDSSAPLLTRIH